MPANPSWAGRAGKMRTPRALTRAGRRGLPEQGRSGAQHLHIRKRYLCHLDYLNIQLSRPAFIFISAFAGRPVTTVISIFLASMKLRNDFSKALLKEIALRKNYPEGELDRDCIFWGGTPSLLTKKSYSSIMDELHKHFDISSSARDNFRGQS